MRQLDRASRAGYDEDDNPLMDFTMLSGDLKAYAHILDCMYKVGHINYNKDLMNKIGFDCLQSGLLETSELIKSYTTEEIIKFFRSIFHS